MKAYEKVHMCILMRLYMHNQKKIKVDRIRKTEIKFIENKSNQYKV